MKLASIMTPQETLSSKVMAGLPRVLHPCLVQHSSAHGKGHSPTIILEFTFLTTHLLYPARHLILLFVCI